jgi:DNA-binding response OmpR family regulator
MQEIKSSCVLIADDEGSVRQVVGRSLAGAGYTVLEASGGREALSLIHEHRPGLVILDLRLPDLSGQEVCETLRADPSTRHTRLLILTGLESNGLASRMLDLGADDYLPKPFDVKELLSRVRAILRRPVFYAAGPSVIEKGLIRIDVDAHLVFLDRRRTQDFSPKEFDVLAMLVKQSPSVLDKETLAQAIWHRPARELHPRTIDVHVRRIRRKLAPLGDRYLRTLPAVGYQWYVPETAPKPALTSR